MKKLCCLLLLMTFVSSCGYEIVDTGRRGVLTKFGKVDLEVGALSEGLHFYNPFTSDITELNVREKKFESAELCYTTDTQEVKVKYAINYAPEPKHIPLFYKNQGEQWANVLVGPAIPSVIKEVVGQYEATNLVKKRGVAEARMKQLLTDQLAKVHVIVTGFRITNLDFDDEFEQAIKKKVIAKEQAIEEQNRTLKVKELNIQKVDSATADATAIQKKGLALAKNPALLKYEWIQKWNGQVSKYQMGKGTNVLFQMPTGR